MAIRERLSASRSCMFCSVRSRLAHSAAENSDCGIRLNVGYISPSNRLVLPQPRAAPSGRKLVNPQPYCSASRSTIASDVVMNTVNQLGIDAGLFDQTVAVLHQCIRPLIGACCAPGHHGYQRACGLISGQASNGPFGSPGFAGAGKTGPPSRFILSQTSAGEWDYVIALS